MDSTFIIDFLLKAPGHLIFKYVVRRKGEIDRDSRVVLQSGFAFWMLIGFGVGLALYLVD